MVCLRSKSALRRGRPPRQIGRGGGGGRRKYRLWLGAKRVSRYDFCRDGFDDQRPRQRRVGDYGGIHTSGGTARLRRFLFFIERTHRRRPTQARPGWAGAKNHFVRFGRSRRRVTEQERS